MNTCPGASHELTPRALNKNLIRSAAVTFLEGYLWGPERPRHAMLRAAQIAHEAERTVAFTLSESLCIPGRKEGVLGMIEGGMIDVLFANEDEAMHLSGATDLGAAIARLQPLVSTLIVTRGPAGALAIERGRRVEIAAAPVEKVVDTTGAGDLFAAGFLAARCRARPLERCLEAGALAAAEVISHFGARPEANLREIVRL
jgi:sugar/nucleoside kinase (ribokinase family)